VIAIRSLLVTGRPSDEGRMSVDPPLLTVRAAYWDTRRPKRVTIVGANDKPQGEGNPDG